MIEFEHHVSLQYAIMQKHSLRHPERSEGSLLPGQSGSKVNADADRRHFP